MHSAKPIENLVEQFQRLPGIGPRTAERLTYWLLRAPQERAQALADAVIELKLKTKECAVCFNVAESNPCRICLNSRRDKSKILVVEEPLDLIAIEKTGRYGGVYHVLGGVLNPLEGIGPEALRIGELIQRVADLSATQPHLEIILATNPNMEGETTAMYIAKKLREALSALGGGKKIKITRIARGLPTGADVEYADKITLVRALEGRTSY